MSDWSVKLLLRSDNISIELMIDEHELEPVQLQPPYTHSLPETEFWKWPLRELSFSHGETRSYQNPRALLPTTVHSPISRHQRDDIHSGLLPSMHSPLRSGVFSALLGRFDHTTCQLTVQPPHTIPLPRKVAHAWSLRFVGNGGPQSHFPVVAL